MVLLFAIFNFCLTELISFDFHYNGAVVPGAMALGCAYSKVLIWVNMVMLSTQFASNPLIVHDKKTQAMILGNPFQERVLHIGDRYFLKEIIFPSKSS